MDQKAKPGAGMMMNDDPALLIQFDPETFEPVAVFYKAETDKETAKLREMVDKMKIESVTQQLPSDFCLLCGSKPSIIGVFIPEEPEGWGSAKGKRRVFRYCLCENCYKMPDTPDRAEKIIRAELTGGGVTHDE